MYTSDCIKASCPVLGGLGAAGSKGSITDQRHGHAAKTGPSPTPAAVQADAGSVMLPVMNRIVFTAVMVAYAAKAWFPW